MLPADIDFVFKGNDRCFYCEARHGHVEFSNYVVQVDTWNFRGQCHDEKACRQRVRANKRRASFRLIQGGLE
jgi:hypothetical protein